MSAQILDDLEGILTLEVTGTLREKDLSQVQAEALEVLCRWGGGSLPPVETRYERR